MNILHDIAHTLHDKVKNNDMEGINKLAADLLTIAENSSGQSYEEDTVAFRLKALERRIERVSALQAKFADIIDKLPMLINFDLSEDGRSLEFYEEKTIKSLQDLGLPLEKEDSTYFFEDKDYELLISGMYQLVYFDVNCDGEEHTEPDPLASIHEVKHQFSQLGIDVHNRMTHHATICHFESPTYGNHGKLFRKMDLTLDEIANLEVPNYLKHFLIKNNTFITKDEFLKHSSFFNDVEIFATQEKIDNPEYPYIDDGFLFIDGKLKGSFHKRTSFTESQWPTRLTTTINDDVAITIPRFISYENSRTKIHANIPNLSYSRHLLSSLRTNKSREEAITLAGVRKIYTDISSTQ